MLEAEGIVSHAIRDVIRDHLDTEGLSVPDINHLFDEAAKSVVFRLRSEGYAVERMVGSLTRHVVDL